MNNDQAVSFIEFLHHGFREHVVVINVPGSLDMLLFKIRFITKIDKCGPIQLSGSLFADDAFVKIALVKMHEGMQKFLFFYQGIESCSPALDTVSHPIDILVPISNRQPGGVIGFPSGVTRAIGYNWSVLIYWKQPQVKVDLAQCHISDFVILWHHTRYVNCASRMSFHEIGRVAVAGNH